MKKKILLTRPRASSQRWATLLARHGFDSAIEPLLTLAATGAPRPPGQFQAVMITSSNALDALQESKQNINDLLPLPCFCVGSATGEAARLFGFSEVRCGDGDGAALAQTITTALGDKSLPVLHIAGDIVDGRAEEILTKNGFTLTLWPVYQASAVEDFTPATRASFTAGNIAAIPVFSPRSARVLVSLIEKNRLAPACHAITAIGFSQAVADVLQTLPWRHLRVAKNPTEEEMLACLQAETSMTEPETKPILPASPVTSAPRRAKTGRWIWGLLAIFILAGAGSVALLQWPWVRDIVAGGENEQTSQDIAALQKRVTALEARIDMQSELPAAQPAATAAQPTPVNADVAALGDTVKNLQTEVAQLQGQAQKSLAAAFAFWDLRDAVNRGQAFAPQLAALRNAAGGDASVTEPASRLDAYAATGVPSLAQLHDMLLAQEPAATAPPLPETPSLGDRAKSILRNLVSVHPLHDAQFAALENALDAGDAAATAEAFRALPAEAQQHLAAWQEKLTARLEADQALRALQAHFMATGNAS